MRLDDFILDLVGSFLFGFLLLGATVFVKLFSIGLDLNDFLLGGSFDLLELA